MEDCYFEMAEAYSYRPHEVLHRRFRFGDHGNSDDRRLLIVTNDSNYRQPLLALESSIVDAGTEQSTYRPQIKTAYELMLLGLFSA
jgi:hypothetical protein